MNEQAADPLHNEKESFKSMAKKLEHVHLASTIKLNVGGQYFTTSLQTLTKDKGSMLHAMFSGRFDTKPAEDGTYFIDRDGTHFRYILNYLRTGRLLFPKDELIREELLEEAEFYQIRGILEELRHPPNQPFKDSTVLSTEHKQVLINNFLKEQLSDESNVTLSLFIEPQEMGGILPSFMLFAMIRDQRLPWGEEWKEYFWRIHRDVLGGR